MATSASTFAAELVNELVQSRQGCEFLDEFATDACDAPGGRADVWCPNGHRKTIVLCPQHVAEVRECGCEMCRRETGKLPLLTVRSEIA